MWILWAPVHRLYKGYNTAGSTLRRVALCVLVYTCQSNLWDILGFKNPRKTMENKIYHLQIPLLMSWTLRSQRWCQYFQIYSIPLHIPLPSFTHLSDKETAAKESQPNDSNKQTNSQYQRKNLSFVSNSLNQTSFQTQRFILIIYNRNKSMRKRVRSRGQRKGKTITTNLFSLMREEKIKG